MLNENNVIWVDISGYEGRYQVSNTGLVRSILTNHGKPQEKLRPTRARSESCPYLYVQLWKDNVPKTFAVHRLVAEAFVPNPDNKPMVNHIDGCKLTNDAYNLEWVTCSENHIHAYATGLKSAEAHAERMVGTKWGKGSSFHNVSWDSSREKWKATLKDKGKMIFQRRFDAEIEAAIFVNQQLDALGYSDRPRNVIPLNA